MPQVHGLAVESLERRRLLSVTPFDEQPLYLAASSLFDANLLAGWAQRNDEFGQFKDAAGRSIATAAAPPQGELVFTGQWLARLATSGSATNHELKSLVPALMQLGELTTVRTVESLQNTLLVGFDPATSLARATSTLLAAAQFESLVPLFARQQFGRAAPNDPLFVDQWHLQNTGQSGGTAGQDVNIVDAWDSYLGSGVVIAIVDDGLEFTHPDLSTQYLASASFDFNDNDTNPEQLGGDSHGTSVAGVAVARGNNSTGVTGSAPLAQLAGLRLTGAATTDAQEAAALSFAPQTIDIYTNSWGPLDDGQRLAGPGALTLAALEAGVTNGRGGLGSIYVWSAGNGLAAGDNVNYDGYANSRYVIAVSAVDHNGVQSNYSEPGAPILVAAYSSGAGAGITTTTTSAGYTSIFGGTSAAAPLVSGVIALMLEANPNLTYRDVQQILVETAVQNDAFDSGWTLNGAGRLVNHKYGFGVVDALAAVTAATSWTTVAPEQTYASLPVNVGLTVPDNNATGISSSINVVDDLTVERVEVVFSATHSFRGDLRVVLTSPDGTQSILAEPHSDPNNNYTSWTFTSTRHWGESSVGQWTLTVSDEGASDVGTWNNWSLRLHGTDAPVGPAAPRIVSSTPTGNVALAVDTLLFHFNESMDQASFALVADVVSFTGPAGDLVGELTGFSWLDADTLQVTFNSQVAPGTYTLVLGSQILDLNDGFALDQNLNGTPGEAVDDRYTATFTIELNELGEIRGSKWNDLDGDAEWDNDEPGLEDWTIFLDLNENGLHDTTTQSIASTNVPLAITDLTTITSTLEVDALLGTVSDVNVTVSITHTFDGDLDVFLVGPTGAQVELFTDVGGNGQNFTGTTLDDQAALLISAGSAPFSGSYRPEGLLSLFNGLDPTGTWTLRVTDDANLDVGTLVSWSLEISYLEPHTTTDENGAYAFTNLPAGTYVVAELMQEGWTQTYPAPGGGGGGGGNSASAGIGPRQDAPVLLPVTTTASTAPLYLAGELISSSPSLGQSPRTNVSSPLINLPQFRADARFAGIDGSGFASVIIDTGIDLNHPYFGPDSDSNGVADRIVYSWDFADNDSDASDVNGHGSNVASIVASQNATFGGMAPAADIIALKVFPNSGSGSNFGDVEDALQWVIANASTYNIVSVNMSLGDSANYTSNVSLYGLGDELAALSAMNVIVVSSAGNGFFTHNSTPGISYPAADPNSLAVGAVWDSNAGGPFNFSSGASDLTTGADRITSFSQRHSTLLDIFAPGAPITGAGATGGTTTYTGTSQASPHIAGIAVLAQQLALQELGRRLTFAEFRTLLQTTGVTINDGDDENDNVTNTGLNFPRVDVFALGEAILELDGPGSGDPVVGPGTHTVVLAAGEIVDDINFGNKFGNSPPQVDAGGPYTILEGEALELDASNTTDADAWDVLAYSWDVNGDEVFGDAVGVSPTLDWATLVTLGIADGPGSWNVKVRVDDGAGNVVDSTVVLLHVGNAPPTADAGGPYSLDEGGSLTLSAIGSDPAGASDPLTFLWDLDGNGFFGDVIGQSLTVTWSQLVELGLGDGPDTFDIVVRASDGDGGVTDSLPITVTVNNLPPIANAGGPYLVAIGGEVTLAATATDPAGAADPLTYAWDLDDDGEFDDATGAAPTITWSELNAMGINVGSGVHTIRVEVDDGDGGVTVAATTLDVDDTPPVASAGGPYTGNEGTTISLNASASVGTITLYEWDLDNDGQYDDAVGSSTLFSATDDGVFTVGLRVTGPNGSTTDSATITVENLAPTASAGGPYAIDEGQPLALTSVASDPAGAADPLTYTWDLNDDGIFGDALGAAPSVTWSQLVALGILDGPTARSIRVRVDDGDGGVTTSLSATLTVNNAPPTSVSAGGPYSIEEGASLLLSATASDPAGVADPLTYTWDLNDDGLFGDAIGATPSVGWSQLVALGIDDGPSTWNVRVRVSDDDGGVTTSTAVALSINNLPPTLVSAGGPYSVSEGSSLALFASATDPVDALTYAWDLNDDGLFDDATGSSPTLAWSELAALGIDDGPAAWNIRVRVSDGDGGVVDSSPVLLTVNNTPPTASAGGPYSIYLGSSLLLAASASDPAGTADPLSYTWDLNDDEVFGDALGAAPTITWGELLSLGLGAIATTNIRVRVSDGDGGTTDSAVATLTIQAPPPVANAGGPYAGDEGTTIGLSAAASTGDIALYEWDLDDDGLYEVTGANTDFAALDDGTYTIRLRVTGPGGSTTDVTTIDVANLSPTGVSAGGPYTIAEGDSLVLAATASDPPIR